MYWLEKSSNCKRYTNQEIHLKMAELNNRDNVYITMWLKQELKEQYKDHLYSLYFLIELMLYVLKICPTISLPVKEQIFSNKRNSKADIRELQQSKNMCPSVNNINDDGATSSWAPKSLNTFFQCLIPSELKWKSICQCINQALRPRSIMRPIPFGSDVETELKFTSKWLVNHLYQFGFSIKWCGPI